MKVNFTQLIKNLENQPIMDANNGNTALTLGLVAAAALLQVYPDESPDGEEKFARYELASKLYSQQEGELSPADVTRIKTLVGKLWPVNILGPVYRMLAAPAEVVPIKAVAAAAPNPAATGAKRGPKKKAAATPEGTPAA